MWNRRGKVQSRGLLRWAGSLWAVTWVIASPSFAQGRKPAQTLSVTYSDPQLETQKKKNFRWADENRYRDCGQACLYKKGNENLTMQMLYTLELVDQLKNADADERLEALRGFCTGPELAQTEGGDACFARYKARAKLILLGVRRAIVENKGMVGKLKSGNARAILPTLLQLESRLGGPDPYSKFAQAPSAMTLDELTGYYSDELGRINQLASLEYEAWSKSIPTEPSPDDFILFKEIKRNPQDPESETVVVPVTDCVTGRIQRAGAQGGRDAICYNEAKYQAALTQYQARRDEALGLKGTPPKIKVWGQGEADGYKPSAEKRQIYRPLGKGEKVGSTLAQEAYRRARRDLNRTTLKARGQEAVKAQKEAQKRAEAKKAGGPELPNLFDPNAPIVRRSAAPVTPVVPGAADPDAVYDEEPAPARGAAAKDLSVSVQPKDDTYEPGAKDSFLEETMALDPN